MDKIDVEIRPTNMSHEMFKKGIEFNDLAANTNDVYEKASANQFAVISFAISFESFINLYLFHRLKVLDGNSSLTTQQEGILKYFKNQQNKIPDELLTINNKLRLFETIYNLQLGSIKKLQQHKDFDQLIKMRNKIAHYAHRGFTEVYGKDCEQIAMSGKDWLIDLIIEICNLSNEKTPNFISCFIVS